MILKVCRTKRMCMFFMLTGFLGQGVAHQPGTTVSEWHTEGESQRQYSCFIEPSETIDLGSPVAGLIEEILVERATPVSANQIVARLESTIEDTNLRVAAVQAQFSAEVIEYETLTARLKEKYRRAKAMYEQHAIPGNAYQDARMEYQVAAQQLENARHKRRVAQIEYDRAKRLREIRNIRSPIDGVVIERLLGAGELVQDKPILTIAKIDPLKVEVILSVESFGTVTPGQQLRIRALELDTEHEATVSLVDQVVDSASGTYRATLTLPNPEHQIAGGLKCEVLDQGIAFSQVSSEQASNP